MKKFKTRSPTHPVNEVLRISLASFFTIRHRIRRSSHLKHLKNGEIWLEARRVALLFKADLPKVGECVGGRVEDDEEVGDTRQDRHEGSEVAGVLDEHFVEVDEGGKGSASALYW